MTVHHNLPATTDTVRIGVVDQSFPPVLSIASGDTVSIETWNAWGNSVTPETTIEDILSLLQKFPDVGPHDLTGPIEVRDALPGQVLQVDVLELTLRTHGYNLNLPGDYRAGLLPEDFAQANIRHYELDLDSMTTEFLPGIRLPLRPFLGFMGVAPQRAGPHNSIPPGSHGGNIDLRDLCVGSTLFLPIWIKGARFYAGDAHACQGNGEVNLTALEASVREARLRLTVLEGPPIARPRAETPQEWITMAFHEDLHEATKLACRDMVNFITQTTDLDAVDGYALCSLAMDLSVTQVVNQTVGVHATLPKSVLEG